MWGMTGACQQKEASFAVKWSTAELYPLKARFDGLFPPRTQSIGNPRIQDKKIEVQSLFTSS